MKIALLCPSRGRPDLAKRMVDSVLATAVHPQRVEILFYLNGDDPEAKRYIDWLTQPEYKGSVRFTVGTDAPTAYSWNLLAQETDADLLMLCGDDCVFQTRGWDNAFEATAGTFKNGIGVLSFMDGRSAPGTGHPHPVVSRKFMETLGYFTPPLFFHWYVDTWLVTLAQQAGVFHYLEEVLVDHVKPAETTGADDTHRRIRMGVWQARDKLAWELGHRWMQLDANLLFAQLEKPKVLRL